MQNFHVNSTLRFRAKEYQLMTSNNGHDNKIVCSLFRNGEFINSKEMHYEQKNDEQLLELIRQFHEQRKIEIEQLFYISERLKEEKNSELQNMLGLIFAKNNMHAEAIREFTTVIDENPANSWAYENMGKALLALKRYDAALKAFERAIEISPNYADLHNNMGLVYLERGECKQAVDKFDKAIELNPYYAEAYFNKGLAYVLNQINRDDYTLSQNFPLEATRALDKARLINPGYQNDHFSNGLKHFNEGAYQKAFEALKVAKRVGSRSLYRYEKYEYFLKLLFVDETNHFEMIWKYIKFLQDLLKKYPSHADIYNDLGLAYCMLRNYVNEKAIGCFKSALEINPQFEKAQRNFKLSNYERTGSELFLKAITLKGQQNGKLKPPSSVPKSEFQWAGMNVEDE